MWLDAPVARYIPEFAQNGKAAVTLRQVLTHTGGLPAGLGGGVAASYAIATAGGTWQRHADVITSRSSASLTLARRTSTAGEPLWWDSGK